MIFGLVWQLYVSHSMCGAQYTEYTHGKTNIFNNFLFCCISFGVVLYSICGVKIMVNKYYAIFDKTTLIAFGLASESQVKAWERHGFTVLRRCHER